MTNKYLKKIKRYLFFSLLFISCKNESIEYYENGNIKRIYFRENNILQGKMEEFYEDGKNLKAIKYYKNGKLVDSTIYFDEQGKINKISYYNLKSDTIFIKFFTNEIKESEGKFYKGRKINIWNYYHKKGYLKSRFEYIDSCGNQYTNQGWAFNKNGDTLKDYSNYYKIIGLEKNKIYKANDTVHFKIRYRPIISKNSNAILLSSSDLKMNFCNLNNVKFDTIRWRKNDFYINLIFSKKGKKNFRGFIREYAMYNKVDYDERIIYFDIPIEIY